MLDLLWLLLPVAAASGWWAALYSQKKSRARAQALLNSAYGRGLNHLLNEEPDKATEVLVRMVEVDPDTVELHLALGGLFRRRGEVDRAIRVHQNIIARSRLSEDLRAQATLELGRDFLGAGLLDRAEQLFRNLLERGEYEEEVCRHLIDVYQQEKEWQRALEIGRRLQKFGSDSCRLRLSQYHCELAEAALVAGDQERALRETERALEEDDACVRATLLQGDILARQGDHATALQTYLRVERQNTELLPEVIGRLRDCYRRLGDAAKGEACIAALRERYHLPSFGEEGKGAPEPAALVGQALRYRCEQCGFSSRRLFWQCPGCKCWSSVKPLKTVGAA
ncbi:MAG TPA: lipopolysaccharide assembly protein LapB [Gammaproteobacteria bacterium]|nr:lipopolysaccharide assembly protein LapB [Gammaproteobacteria bacterium]